jgi:hypothetical protein
MIFLLSANSILSNILGFIYSHPFAKVLYAAAICNGVTLIPKP